MVGPLLLSCNSQLRKVRLSRGIHCGGTFSCCCMLLTHMRRAMRSAAKPSLVSAQTLPLRGSMKPQCDIDRGLREWFRNASWSSARTIVMTAWTSRAMHLDNKVLETHLSTPTSQTFALIRSHCRWHCNTTVLDPPVGSAVAFFQVFRRPAHPSDPRPQPCVAAAQPAAAAGSMA
jgi:hypothetical protein